jgi:hypothetical protein
MEQNKYIYKIMTIENLRRQKIKEEKTNNSRIISNN